MRRFEGERAENIGGTLSKDIHQHVGADKRGFSEGSGRGVHHQRDTMVVLSAMVMLSAVLICSGR